MNRRRTAEEWRSVLDRQRELGLTDKESGAREGVDPSSLLRWRAKLRLGRERGKPPFVELPVPVPAGDLRIILPNKVELIVGRGWAAGGAMIRDLSQVRIFVRPGSTDMRKAHLCAQIDGLEALVRDGMGCKPGGHLRLTPTGACTCWRDGRPPAEGFILGPQWFLSLAEAAGGGPVPLAPGGRRGPEHHI